MKKEIRKEEKKDNKKKVNDKNNTNTVNALNILFVDIQIVVTILTVILAIVFIFNPKYTKLFEFSLGVNLLVMAFNNYKIYKRSRLTLVYAIVGLLILLLLGV